MASKFPLFFALFFSVSVSAFSPSSYRRSQIHTLEEIQTNPYEFKPPYSFRLKASNPSFDSARKIAVKPRARVMLDRETGKLTEIKSAAVPSNERRIKPWNFIKQTFYSTADAVKSIRGVSKKTHRSPQIVEGYGSTIETTVLKTSTTLTSPGERLMKEYQERSSIDLAEVEQNTNLFNSLKSTIYNTVDGISSLFKKEEPKPQKTPLQSYKAVVQPTLATAPQVKTALPDLKSSSPAKRVLAELQIRGWEEEQRKRKRDYQRQQAANSFKETVYSIGDGFVEFVSSLESVPAKLEEAATATREFISVVPTVVGNTVETVASIPKKVEETVTNIQSTIESSITTTKKTAQEVQALPGKIQKSVKDTKEGIDETITNVKVLVGVEQKKPAPPRVPPPKPRTAEELAWDVAGGVASITGKAAWFVTVGAAKLTFAGAKLAFNKLTETMVEHRTADAGMTDTVVASTAVVETPKAVSIEVDVKVVETPSKPKSSFGSFFGNTKSQPNVEPVPTTVVEMTDTTSMTEQEALDKEVSEALKLAERALALANEEGMDDAPKKNGKKSELDIALEKARKAAVTATAQAVEMEKSNK
jgi:hypothetical protein